MRPPQTVMEMQKPSSMPQTEYSSLSKFEKRQLADPLAHDRAIDIGDYPKLDLQYNQVYYKAPKHGPDHNLPVNAKGQTPNKCVSFT